MIILDSILPNSRKEKKERIQNEAKRNEKGKVGLDHTIEKWSKFKKRKQAARKRVQSRAEKLKKKKKVGWLYVVVLH